LGTKLPTAQVIPKVAKGSVQGIYKSPKVMAGTRGKNGHFEKKKANWKGGKIKKTSASKPCKGAKNSV